MKKLMLIMFVGLMVQALEGFTQDFRKMKNEAFVRGEKLTFRAFYESALTGQVNAGKASLEVGKEVKKIGGRNTYHIIGEGRSTGAFNFFFKVVDKFETYIDEDGLFPWLFIRRTREGGYKKDDDVTFNNYKNLAISRKATKSVPVNVQDIISSYYWARNIDVKNFKKGDEVVFDFFLDDSTYHSKIVYLGKEVVETSVGTFNAIKISPKVATGSTFSTEYPMFIWISDDKNHIPLLAESAVVVGKVKLEITGWEGLANPLTSKIK